MAKGSGGTRAGNASSPRGLPTANKVGMTERQFASITGLSFSLRTQDYQTSLAIANGIPDNETMWTGHKAREVKDALKKIIRAKGGSTRVKLSDYIIDE